MAGEIYICNDVNTLALVCNRFLNRITVLEEKVAAIEGDSDIGITPVAVPEADGIEAWEEDG